DLARNLIVLSGLRPDHDIEIIFSGARPGEKLFEELNEEEEGLLATHHEKIRVFAGATRPWTEIEGPLAQLRSVGRERNSEELLSVFARLVPEYKPSVELLSGAGERALVRTAAGDVV